jgi:hypothetical protein
MLSTGALGWRVHADGEEEPEEKPDELRSTLRGHGQDLTTYKNGHQLTGQTQTDVVYR